MNHGTLIHWTKTRKNSCRWYKSIGLCSNSRAISFVSTLPCLWSLNFCTCLRQVIPSSGKNSENREQSRACLSYVEVHPWLLCAASFLDSARIVVFAFIDLKAWNAVDNLDKDWEQWKGFDGFCIIETQGFASEPIFCKKYGRVNLTNSTRSVFPVEMGGFWHFLHAFVYNLLCFLHIDVMNLHRNVMNLYNLLCPLPHYFITFAPWNKNHRVQGHHKP